MPKKTNPANIIWNILTGCALILICVTIACFSVFFIYPENLFNPFPPETEPPLTTGITHTPTPSNRLPATWTPGPTNTPASTSTDRPTWTPSPTPTAAAPAEEGSNGNRPNDDVRHSDDGRPVLSGDEIQLDTEHFKIHYTLAGTDAVLQENANSGEHPDYVIQVAESLEHVWQTEIEQFGWAAPLPDAGVGGDDRYDIYLQEILNDGTFGYTESSGQSGDNPATIAKETRATASYIVLDNDYAGVEDYMLETYTILDIMHSTVAHEFNHASQFAYDGDEPADWLWEATAAWMQDEVYDDVNDGIEDMYAVAKSPDTCQLAYGGETRVEDENHWYGEWIFIRYISEHYGAETVRAIWEQAAKLDGYAAIEAALSEAGTNLEDVFRAFSVSLLTRAFEEGANYPAVRLEGETGQTTFTPTDGVAQMAADYVSITSNGTIHITLNTSELTGLLVGITGDEAHAFALDGGQTTVNAGQFTHLYLIIINLNQADKESDCETISYTVEVQPSPPVEDAPIPVIYPASNFTPPVEEALLDPEEYLEGSSLDSIDAPPELIPSYLPPGYELVGAYSIDAEEEYGEDAIWYIPGGGTATEVDFYGPGDDDVIAITASESPYTSLTAWLDESDFEPSVEEDQSIHGVRVIVEDYTNEEGIYSFASYIFDGQFIVVEGNVSVEEIAKVVESLLP